MLFIFFRFKATGLRHIHWEVQLSVTVWNPPGPRLSSSIWMSYQPCCHAVAGCSPMMDHVPSRYRSSRLEKLTDITPKQNSTMHGTSTDFDTFIIFFNMSTNLVGLQRFIRVPTNIWFIKYYTDKWLHLYYYILHIPLGKYNLNTC